MFCKRMAHTLLALLLPLLPVSLTSLGCGGSDKPAQPEPPVLSSEAGLAGLSVSVGDLSPAFSPNISNYAVNCYLGEASIGITATLKDTKAKVKVGNLAAASGAVTNVPLAEGINTIRIVVTAEDGVHSNSVTLSVNRLKLNTHVWVLNGLGGVPVENTFLTLTDNRGRLLADNVALPKAKNGAKIFALDPTQKYNIYARGDGAARACFANFDPSKEDTAALYCLRTYSVFFEYEAPVIEDISFATSNSSNADWKTMSNDACYVGPLADVYAVRVTTLTKNLMAGSTPTETDDPYVPVCVNIDETASPNTGGAAGVEATAIRQNVPVTIEGKGQYYRSVYRCALPRITTNIFNKGHFVDIVVYDRLGNRTEQRVYLTITDSTNGVADDLDLSDTPPTWNVVQGQTFMGGGDIAGRPGYETNSMDPVDPYTGYQQVIVQFYVRAKGLDATPTANLPIRGYEVWRSVGGANSMVKIATVNYATLTTGNPFQYIDLTPSLAAGDVYYRIRAFNGNPLNNGYSPLSATIRARVLPPTTTGPAPSHEMVSHSMWPTFRIAASNPAMLNKDTSDRFNFTLFVKYADNPYPFLMVPIRLNFTETEQIGTDPNSYENQHRYGFPQGRPTAEFRYVTNWTESGVSGDWHYAYDETGDADRPYEPFAYLDDDGSVVVNTDSETFRWAADNYIRYAITDNVGEPFLPGATYFWNLFGASGGYFWNSWAPLRWPIVIDSNAAFFTKDYNSNGKTYLGCSFGSHLNYGLGSPEGWFPLVIAADAE